MFDASRFQDAIDEKNQMNNLNMSSNTELYNVQKSMDLNKNKDPSQNNTSSINLGTFDNYNLS